MVYTPAFIIMKHDTETRTSKKKFNHQQAATFLMNEYDYTVQFNWFLRDDCLPYKF